MGRHTAVWPRVLARCVLPTPWAERQGAVRAVDRLQAGQVGPQGAVVAHRGDVVAAVQTHGRIEAGIAGPTGRRAVVAEAGLTGEDQQQRRRVRQVLLVGPRPP